MTRRQFLAAAATTAAGLVTAHTVAGTYDFRVERHLATVARLRAGVRVAFLCDLHYGLYIRRDTVARWVDATTSFEPDLIVLGGDLVDRLPGGGDFGSLVTELAHLHAPLGVYATWGNHDRARPRELGAFDAALRGAGITVLTNAGTLVRDDLYVAGIDDFRSGRPDIGAALRGRPEASACLLISHTPDALPHVPTTVDLTLCGHTHGGQIRLPGVGALVTSSRYGRRFLEGWVSGPARGYVSRGLGFGLIPLRVDCPAELTILDLTP